MMNYDARTVFSNLMQKGYELECDGRYSMASSRYKNAYELAKEHEDSAADTAKECMSRCDNKLKKSNEYVK